MMLRCAPPPVQRLLPGGFAQYFQEFPVPPAAALLGASAQFAAIFSFLSCVVLTPCLSKLVGWTNVVTISSCKLEAMVMFNARMNLTV